MSRAIFNAISGGTVTLDAQDTVDNKVLVIPAANGTLLYDDGTGTQTFDNVVVTGNATIASGQVAATAVDPTDIANKAYVDNAIVADAYTAGTGIDITSHVIKIADTGASAGSYGSASSVPVFTLNAQGQLSAAVSTAIAIAANQITSGVIASARISGFYPNITGVGNLVDLTVTNTITGSISGNAGTATNIYGGVSGSIPYQTAANTTALLAPGINGQVLALSAGLPTWTTLSGAGTVTSVATGTGLTGGPITSSGTINFSNANVAAWAANPTSANLAAAVSDETGSGALVFGTSPTLSGPTIDGANPYIQFNNGSAVTVAAGKLWYDGSTGSFNAGMGGGNITQQIGEELFRYGKASSAITDSPLQIVYKTGVVGASGVITFAPTVSGITDSDLIIGVATEPIALNGFGRVTTYGVIHGINTTGSAYGETWADGDDIWYNPVTGNPTKTKPSAPNIKLQIGTVISAGAGSGSFVVKLGTSSSLGGTDSNVQLGTLSNADLLQYDSTAQYWKNVTPASVTGIGSVANAVTFNNAGTGDASGTTFNGSAAKTISYNTIGAQPAGTYVTSVSISSSNGFTGTSSGGATPALTLATSISGVLKGSSSALAAATAGTDFVAPATATNFTAQQYFGNVALTDGATISWAANTAQTATFTFVSSNRTMGAPSGLVNGAFYALAVIQNGGSNTLTWNSVFKWAGGTAPTLSTAAGAKDYFVFRSDGTNMYEQGRSLGVA